MINPTLILVVQSKLSSVSYLGTSLVAAELHSLTDVDNGKAVTAQVRPAIADGHGESLAHGVHVLVGRPTQGFGCKVLSGDVTVIVPTGGEDPWPTPPPKAFEDGESESVEAEGESPSTEPPPPKMSDPMRAYVRRLMSTPR
jgi:hypothetical protein